MDGELGALPGHHAADAGVGPFGPELAAAHSDPFRLHRSPSARGEGPRLWGGREGYAPPSPASQHICGSVSVLFVI